MTRKNTSQNSPKWILAVDGGGTKTIAWIAKFTPNAGPLSGKIEVVGRGFSGPSNPRSVGFLRAISNLDLAMGAAFEDASIATDSLSIACLSLAGVSRPAEKSELMEWAESRQLAKKIMIVEDVAPLALAAEYEQELDFAHSSGHPIASDWGQSITLVVGTGSIACGVNANQERVRAGGWGYLLGDEGSGFAIGLAGLQAVCRAHDQTGPETELESAMLSPLGFASVTQLVAFVYQTPLPRTEIAKLAEVVIKVSERDSVAAQIIDSAVDSMANLIGVVVKRLRLEPSEVSLALSGGILNHHASMVNRLLTILSRGIGTPRAIHVIRQPIHGPLVLAARDLD
jgi:N-acetylglucosamine kinase-like BadF-type ATPase